MQPELEGAPLVRAKAILDLPPGGFDLKELITEDNLKKFGLLSPRVGSICPFLRFRNGKAVKSNNEDLEEVDDDEELLQEENVTIDPEFNENVTVDSEETMKDGIEDASSLYFFITNIYDLCAFAYALFVSYAYLFS